MHFKPSQQLNACWRTKGRADRRVSWMPSVVQQYPKSWKLWEALSWPSCSAVRFGQKIGPSSRSRPLIDKCHPWNVRETLCCSSKGLWAARAGMSDQIPLRSTPRSVHFLPSAISQFFLESWPRDTSHMLIVLPPRHKKPFQENCVYLLLLHGNDSWRENKEHFGGSVLLCMNVLSRERVCVLYDDGTLNFV